MASLLSSPASKSHYITTSTLFLSSLASLPSPNTHPLSASLPLPAVPTSVPPTSLIPNSRFLVDAFRHAGDFCRLCTWPKIPNLYVQTSLAQADSVNISLPIENYLPIENAGQPALYLHLARTFDLVEREKGKINTTAMLCNMFRRFSYIYNFQVYLYKLLLITHRICSSLGNIVNIVSSRMQFACLIT